MTGVHYKEPGESLGCRRAIDIVAQKRCSVVVLSDMNINDLWLEARSNRSTVL